MRPLSIALLTILAVLILSARPSVAQNYPWCAIYSGRGGSNCGFVSFAQCMATVSGIGGFCRPNTMYVPTGPRYGARYVPRRHHHSRYASRRW